MTGTRWNPVAGTQHHEKRQNTVPNTVRTPVECLLIDYILSAKVRVGLVAAVVRKHSNNLAALL